MQQTPDNWHAMDSETVMAALETTKAGLTAVEAARRLAEHGPNQLQSSSQVPAWSLLLQQFKNVLIVILLISILLSAFLGHEYEALAIAVIVLFAVLLGFIQEYRAGQAIEALRCMAAPTATVLRDNKEIQIPAQELVPGDVILLCAGNRIPADVRVLESVNLQTDEAALTGESVSVSKQADPLFEKDPALGDRTNMGYAGTIVTYGRGRAVVIATGMGTEFGKIAYLLQKVESGRTPLQENLDRLGRSLAKAAAVVVILIVVLGLFRGQPVIDILIFGIALAVAVVPEALPAVVTISLAIGMQRLVRRHALMRRLAAVETLGSVSVICSDKTGTLTKNEMTVRLIAVDGCTLELSGTGYAQEGHFLRNGSMTEPSATVKTLLQAAVLASDARIIHHECEMRWEIQGDPTEGALVVAAAKAGLERGALENRFPRIAEIPFSSESKRMTTLHACGDGVVAYSKGAPEVILDSCVNQYAEHGEIPLDDASRDRILETARQMASEALRVLAVACRSSATMDNAEQEMTFLGLAGMIDPPRAEAGEAVQKCLKAGIIPVMITGDHPLTAQTVARELGILTDGRVITGVELEAMDDAELEQEVDKIQVYARVSPEHKLRVVSALQKRGHVVAMTGDGVNDAPALKKADIGIAMGISGTDVTREAADMTLMDDNFASIVAAIEEGRGIFSNIKKYLMYLLSANCGEIGLMAIATLSGLPLPLSAIQILYVNLATDGLPALALAVDPAEPDLMRRRPRDPRSGIFTRPVVTLMLAGGIWSTLVNASLFAWALSVGQSREYAMTMTFVSLIMIEFLKAFSFRSDRRSLFKKPWPNRWLNISIAWELALLILIMYIPFLRTVFTLVPLSVFDLAIVLLLAFSVVPVLESVKFLIRRGWFEKKGLT
jgi:Ca2+-transporting ATPase